MLVTLCSRPKNERMKRPTSYIARYEAMPAQQRKRVLALLKKWGGWTKTTVYRKLAGESLSPIEEVLIDGVFRRYASGQTEIEFVWDNKQSRPRVK